MARASWVARPHGPIARIAENLWLVRGPCPGLPMPLERTMAVARLGDGRLVIHGAIALAEPAQRGAEAWGEPAILYVPSGYHRIDAPAYRHRYPSIRVLCPAPARRRVGQRVRVDGTIDDFPADERVRCEPLAGTAEGVMSVRSGEGAGSGETTLVFNDAFFNQPRLGGVAGWLYHVLGSTGSPRVTPIAQWALVRDRVALARHLTRLADAPGLRRIVPGHGDLVETGAADVLRAVAASPKLRA